MEDAVIVLRFAVVCGPLLIVTVIHMPSLAALFRRRLRDQLALTHRSQTALADHLDLDKSQVSRILKYDNAANAVRVGQIEAIAVFVSESPANLLRTEDDEPVSLSPVERELLELIRMLPDEQKGLLAKWLAFVFPERHAAKQERAMMRALNLHRQSEREREAAEMQRLKKQLKNK